MKICPLKFPLQINLLEDFRNRHARMVHGCGFAALDRHAKPRLLRAMSSVPTLKQLQRAPGWHWAYCSHCHHSEPLAIAPFVIRWGPDTSSDYLRKNLVCARCRRRGAELYHPSWVNRIVGWQPFPTDLNSL
jgi:hypothetical protein